MEDNIRLSSKPIYNTMPSQQENNEDFLGPVGGWPSLQDEVEDIAEELDQIALSRVTSINGTLVQMWDRNVLSAYVQSKVTSLTEAHKVEMEKLVAEILKLPYYGTVKEMGNDWAIKVDDIKEKAKEFNIEVK